MTLAALHDWVVLRGFPRLCFQGRSLARLVQQPYRCNEPRVLTGRLHATNLLETQSHPGGTARRSPRQGDARTVRAWLWSHLGNALRRVLLSSMVGYAPTEVTIAGVLHEYSTIDGVCRKMSSTFC